MKVKVTVKQALYGAKKVFIAGDLQTLFPGHTAPCFHAGIYGWNADYFVNPSRDIVMVSGDRPGIATRGFKSVDLPFEFTKAFEQRAKLIVEECGWTKAEEREKRMSSLRREFWEALDNYTEEV